MSTTACDDQFAPEASSVPVAAYNATAEAAAAHLKGKMEADARVKVLEQAASNALSEMQAAFADPDRLFKRLSSMDSFAACMEELREALGVTHAA